MSRLASFPARALAWSFLGTSVSVGMLFLLSVSPVSGVLNSYIYWGMASSVNCSDFQHDPDYSKYWLPGWAYCWHKDEGSTDAFGNAAYYSAIDYTRSGGGTSGTLVQLWYTGADLWPYFRSLPSGYNCTGLRVDTYNTSTGAYMGDLHYLHIGVYSGVIGTRWQNHSQTDGYWWRDLGTVSGSQPTGCGWTGPHLHQSANVAGWTPYYSNGGVNPTTTWQHRMTR